MSERTYAVELTAEELRALFMECNCCAPREAFESATTKVWNRLKRISEANGGFKKKAAA